MKSRLYRLTRITIAYYCSLNTIAGCSPITCYDATV